jgi:hypothetical protein
VRLNRTKGAVLWMRAHFDGRLRVEIRGTDRGGSIVLVRRGHEPMREAELGVAADAARDAADTIVQEVLPHDCRGSECGSWVAMGAVKN